MLDNTLQELEFGLSLKFTDNIKGLIKNLKQ